MGEEVERYTSYGRGGAGNLRKLPSLFHPIIYILGILIVFLGRPSTRVQASEALAALAENGMFVLFFR